MQFIQNYYSFPHRLFNALCSLQENRGIVVQQGGTKALLSLAAEGTEKGKQTAANALARIAITINPEVAFPGQRVSKLRGIAIFLCGQDKCLIS